MKHTRGTSSKLLGCLLSLAAAFTVFFLIQCMVSPAAFRAEADIVTPTQLTLPLSHNYGADGTVAGSQTLPLSADGTTRVDAAQWAVTTHSGKQYNLDSIDISILALYEFRYYKDSVSAANYLSSDYGHAALQTALPVAGYTLKTASSLSGINGFTPFSYDVTPQPMPGNPAAVQENPDLNIQEYVFIQRDLSTTYTIKHVDILDDSLEVAPDDTGTLEIGDTLSADLVKKDGIANYIYSHGDPGTLVLSDDAASNVMYVYYTPLTSYIVKYIKYSTGEEIYSTDVTLDHWRYDLGVTYSEDARIGNPVGAVISVDDIIKNAYSVSSTDSTGYTWYTRYYGPDSSLYAYASADPVDSITLQRNASANVINLYYLGPGTVTVRNIARWSVGGVVYSEETSAPVTYTVAAGSQQIYISTPPQDTAQMNHYNDGFTVNGASIPIPGITRISSRAMQIDSIEEGVHYEVIFYWVRSLGE